MAKAKTTSFNPRAVATAFAAAERGGPAAWQAVEAQVLAAIDAAPDATGVQRLFAEIDKLADGGAFYTDGPAWPSLADALIARARTAASPDDTAALLALCARLCTFRPTDVVRPDRFPALVDPDKQPFVAAVDRHVGELRALLDAPAPASIAAAAVAARARHRAAPAR